MTRLARVIACIGAVASTACWRPRPNDAAVGRWAHPEPRTPLAAAEAQAGVSIQASWDAPGSPFSLVGVQRDSEGQDSASDILTEDTDPNQLLEMLEGPAPPTPTASDLERERYRARMVPVPRCLHAGDGGLVEGPCGSTRDGGVHPAGAPAPSERIEERYRGRLVPTRP